MKLIYIFTALMFTPFTTHAESPEKMDGNGFVTHKHALTCIQKNKDIASSQQKLQAFDTRKATLKGKIEYLQKEIQIRRNKIEELDQRHFHDNNKNYNQLISQFDELMAERKQTVAQYNKEDLQHIEHNNNDIDMQNYYIEQCLNNIKITKNLHSQICKTSNNPWCEGFSF